MKIRKNRIQTIINKIIQLNTRELWRLSKELYVQNPVAMTNLDFALRSLLNDDIRLIKMNEIRKKRGLTYDKRYKSIKLDT